MLAIVELLAGTNWLLLGFSVFVFDIPRYTLSLLSLALFGVRKPSAAMPAGSASPPRLSHPLRAGRLGGNRRPDKCNKPSAPARALGSRRFAHPLHDVWRIELLSPARALAGHVAAARLHRLRSRSPAHLCHLPRLCPAVVAPPYPALSPPHLSCLPLVL